MDSGHTGERERPGKTAILVFNFVEAAIVCLLVLMGSPVATHPLLIFVQIAGLWIILWVLWTNSVKKFRITLDLPPETRFVAKGPYSFVRYPVYTALLVITLTLVIDRLEIEELVLWLLLFIVFIFDIRYEERLYTSYFGDYSLYRDRTSRLIPYVY
ncbi:MAG TPA: methyltransferase [Thermodesulfobacteriota bacterium]|nr:methyltransferase [Thermodesulfobacteriota bacterium]